MRQGVKRRSKNVLAVAALALSASAQRSRQSAWRLSAPQLPRKARQASSWRSMLQLGRSGQAARLHAGLGAGVADGGLLVSGSHAQGAQAAAGAQAGALVRAPVDDCGGGAIPELVDAGGGAAHAVSVSAAARMGIRKSRLNGAGMFEGGMWIFYVEMLVVLALGGFIVWWTMPKKKAPQPGHTPVSSPTQAAHKLPEPESAHSAAADTQLDAVGTSGQSGQSSKP